MEFHGLIHTFPKYKNVYCSFCYCIEYWLWYRIIVVNTTNSNKPNGIEENYLGNENDEEAAVMNFKKSDREMLTTLHSYVLSMFFISLFIGVLLAIISLPKKLKPFLMIESFISIIIIFGGIYLLWNGMLWMKYVIQISGMLMTVVFITSVLTILYQLLKKEN